MKNLIAYFSFFLVTVEAVAQVNVTGKNPCDSLLSVDQNIEDFNFALKESPLIIPVLSLIILTSGHYGLRTN